MSSLFLIKSAISFQQPVVLKILSNTILLKASFSAIKVEQRT